MNISHLKNFGLLSATTTGSYRRAAPVWQINPSSLFKHPFDISGPFYPVFPKSLQAFSSGSNKSAFLSFISSIKRRTFPGISSIFLYRILQNIHKALEGLQRFRKLECSIIHFLLYQNQIYPFPVLWYSIMLCIKNTPIGVVSVFMQFFFKQPECGIPEFFPTIFLHFHKFPILV